MSETEKQLREWFEMHDAVGYGKEHMGFEDRRSFNVVDLANFVDELISKGKQ